MVIHNLNTLDISRYFNKYSTQDIIEFINRRFPSKEDKQWVEGNCYYFSLILKSRFPEGSIVYDTIDGHFLFLFNSMLIDSVHHEWVSSSFNMKPSMNNPRLNKTIVYWDYFKYYDSEQYKRIIRDCIS